MENTVRENIKIGLLAIIAVTLTINTYLQIPSKTEKSRALQQEQISGSTNGQLNHNNPSSSPVISEQVVAPEISSGPPTNIKFAEVSHNFGKLKQDTQSKHVFKFTNTGSNPLIIENAVGSCGCTVPQYPKEPIAPGKTGEIVVEYSPGKQQGIQNKTVTVTANTEPKQSVLNITADVEP